MSKNKYPKTPELDKMTTVKAESQVIGQFLEGMEEKGIYLCTFPVTGPGQSEYFRLDKSIEQVLADYFEIDLNKVEKERRAVLNYIRKEQGA